MKKTQETLKFTKSLLSDGVMKAEVQGDGLYSESLQKLNGRELVTASQEGHHE